MVIAAADTFRAAANEQLEIWAERAGAAARPPGAGLRPCRGGVRCGRRPPSRTGADVVIIDTAGRLHTSVNLMEELEEDQARDPEAGSRRRPTKCSWCSTHPPDRTASSRRSSSTRRSGVTGLVLTKLDGTAKGGIVLAIAREMNVPVRFIGVGEGLEDLQPFDRRGVRGGAVRRGG